MLFTCLTFFRELQVFSNKKLQISVQNYDRTLYVMEGIQKYTEHSKAAAEGASISVIFRRLTPVTYKMSTMKLFNVTFQVPWHDLALTEQCRKMIPKSFDADIPMQTYWRSRHEFNLSCRHSQPGRVLCNASGTASLCLSNLGINKLDADGANISYYCDNNHYSVKVLKQCCALGHKIRVYAPCPWFVAHQCGILFLGIYLITHITQTTKYEFSLTRNE